MEQDNKSQDAIPDNNHPGRNHITLSTHHILLVEDDPIDRERFQRAIKETASPVQLHVTSTGEQALGFLQGEGGDKTNLILLDLKLPGMSGIELLRAIKSDARLKKIPVVVLTSSNDEKDKEDSFHLHAAGYMLKPIEDTRYREIINAVIEYWTISEFPE